MRPRRRHHAYGGRADDDGHRFDAFALTWDGRDALASTVWVSPDGVDTEPIRGAQGDARARLGSGDRAGVPFRPGSRCRLASAGSPFRSLCQPAVTYARDGFIVSPVAARQLGRSRPALRGASRIRVDLSAGRIARRCRASRFSSRHKRGHASRKSHRHGRDRSIAAALRRRITLAFALRRGRPHMDDFAAHRCDWVEPASQSIIAVTACTKSRRTGRGSSALMALGMLRAHGPRLRGATRPTACTCRSRR